MPVISALGRLRQDDQEFKASLGFIMKLYQKKFMTPNSYCIKKFIFKTSFLSIK
jgi:hypothetical protein